MKACSFCGGIYGTGDPVKEKFCSLDCKSKFSVIKDVMMSIRLDLGLLSAGEVTRYINNLPSEAKSMLYEVAELIQRREANTLSVEDISNITKLREWVKSNGYNREILHVKDGYFLNVN